MSFILKMLHGFPRGRTTEELLVLVGAGFSHDKRLAAIAELDQLLSDGLVAKDRNGRWHASQASGFRQGTATNRSGMVGGDQDGDVLRATAATFTSEPIPETSIFDEEPALGQLDPNALLRYWRSALRADPRGATTQVLDKHGVEWTLVSGRGPIVPEPDEQIRITIALDALNPTFLEALVRREGHENALAVGWPMFVGRRSGVPICQPVGMFAASWHRDEKNVTLLVEADDVLVNPDWLKLAARSSGWTRDSLGELFSSGDGVALRSSEFLEKVTSAVASQIRGGIDGQDLLGQLDGSAGGIYDSAAVFLPSDSSFTAGVARDLDRIASWPSEKFVETALNAVLGTHDTGAAKPVAALDAVRLNKDQLRAVQFACEAPLTVVTGPPGTGKSQAIVSMAASVLASGGSVLVASKNHQALDAVEERLGSLAPQVPFVVRTLKPSDEVDTSFSDALKQLVDNETAAMPIPDDAAAMADLIELAFQRQIAVDDLERIADLQCEIADILERIEYREESGNERSRSIGVVSPPKGRLKNLLSWLQSIFFWWRSAPADQLQEVSLPKSMSLGALHKLLDQRRLERNSIETPRDPIELGDRIREITGRLLPRSMSHRTHVSEEKRRDIAELYDDWQFAGGRGHPPYELSEKLVSQRPLWLASVLGTPRRIPLEAGLFDLVIFDEASQCDIASAIPLFARAKRAVVVGDDRQLSFIPQLGQAQDRNLMQAQGLPVPKMGRFAQSSRSLFDFASRVPDAKRVTLRHQYRSAGPIVDYISENFYGGELETSYDPRTLIVPRGTKPGLAWEHVPAPAVPQIGNVNPSEVSAIVRHLQSLLNDQAYEGSVGVITPFRAQVAALEQAIATSISAPKRIACELKVGTVDGFQGQERDLILFSPCVGPRSPQSGLTFFQRDTRRLNVAISRARAVAMIFGDLDFARSGTSKPLRRLAAMATEPRAKAGEGVFDSGWERIVFHALKERGLDPQPQYEIAGRRLDFALFGANGVKLDLEVDGRRWHQTMDGRRKTSDLWRDHQLQSLGWRVCRFWVDELSSDMEKCLDRVEQELS